MASSLLDVSTFNTWIQAQSDGDTELANLYLRRYSPEFRVGFGGAIEREEEPDEVQHRHPCVDGQAHPGYHAFEPCFDGAPRIGRTAHALAPNHLYRDVSQGRWCACDGTCHGRCWPWG